MLDPYKDINFVKRHAIIKSKDGEDIYNKEVIFPDYFSDTAVNIVASKYFHKSIEKEEVDIRDMIDRVSNCISDWGENQNYFSGEERDIFNYKLTNFQINQLFAFNSPIYFNCGVTAKVQASACFILDVEDNMESITNVMSIEGKIFKKGSGSGMNLSPLRSKYEYINEQTGVASGPVSFLKVHDTLANVIKCITKDTYLFTNYGLLQIKDFIDTSDKIEEGFYEIESNKPQLLNYKYELEDVSHIYYGKEEKLQKIKLKSTGLEIKGTTEHPILTLTKDFTLEWKKLSKINIGDYAAVTRKMETWGKTYPTFENFKPQLLYTRRNITYPKVIDKNLARILGYLIADGFIDSKIRRIRYGKNDKVTVEDFCSCFEKVFGTNIRSNFSTNIQKGRFDETYSITLEWAGLFSFFEFIGLEGNHANKKEIPWCILQSPKEIVVEFLKAYFESDSCLHKGSILNSGSVSEKLTKQTQQLLLNLGILASRKDVIRDGRPYYQLNMLGDEVDKFMVFIGFLTDSKNKLYVKKQNRKSNIDCVPYLLQKLRSKMVKTGGYYKCVDGTIKHIKLGIFEYSSTSNISFNRVVKENILQKIKIIDSEMYNTLKFIVDNNIFWDKIKLKENLDRKERVYDFTLPGTHTFVANGIINHNSGGSLRRSAKLACLNMDHPDIEDFIDCKKYEEEKLSALRDAGIKPRPGCELSDEVFFQSTNLSVRPSNAFMEQVINNGTWDTKYVTTGKTHKTYNARELLYKVAKRTWEMGDPGIQFDDTINEWNTVSNDGRIDSSNPCSEYLFLNNSSCNLAVLNLIKFFDKTDTGYAFNFDLFKDVVETVITAQDIIVDGAVYPTDKIKENSKNYRPLGIGYTNLGSLLMLLGLPYDSDNGRQIASYITALMTGVAYQTSNKLAKKMGAFNRFDANKDPFYGVLIKHSNKVDNLISNTVDSIIKTLEESLFDVWKNICRLTDNNAPFRNAQVSLLMPSGTTSFLLDAQTTGIEPEYSHVKYKRLSNTNDSIIKITSDITKKCLENLGYKDKDILEIECYITDDKSLDLCRCLKKEHKAILDTSTNIYNNQTIHYSGHIKMLAAVQPFISGGISKTVNFPNNCTVDDIFKCYIESWKLGLKGVAIYRDGSKSYQPLSVKNDNENDIEDDIEDDIKSENYPSDDRLIKYMHSILAQKKLSDEVPSITHKFSVGQVKGWITSGMYPTGDLGQIFIDVSKQGSTLSGLFDCISILTSISLQRGVPLKDIVEKMIYQTFSPSGFTSNPQIRTATSIVDYIFKYLGLRFLSKEEQIELGLIKEEEVYNYFGDEQIESESKETIKKVTRKSIGSGKICIRCGGDTIRKGSCDVCMVCGDSGACG